MIKKQVIFNVGGALSSYLEFDDKKVVIDLGKSNDFNPVDDFLLPLAKKKFTKDPKTSKYTLEQVFLSHLDDDHISLIEEFDKHFNPRYLTVPCEHPKQNSIFNIIKNLIIKPKSESVYTKKVLELMNTRLPGYGRLDDSNEPLQEDKDQPLVVCQDCGENIKLYHIPAKICGEDEDLKNDYSNNISLALFIQINGHTIFMPGDLMKNGMEYLLNDNEQLKDDLKNIGIDFLIAPHHGLSTSFPDILFQSMKNNKINRLNIISEKVREINSKEQRSPVDSRYYGNQFCLCNNNIDRKGGIKTSGGHIIIDYDLQIPSIKIIKTENKEDLVNEFIS